MFIFEAKENCNVLQTDVLYLTNICMYVVRREVRFRFIMVLHYVKVL